MSGITKDILRSLLDIPLGIVAGMGLASWAGRRNVFMEEPAPFIICFLAGWAISFLIRRHKRTRVEKKA